MNLAKLFVVLSLIAKAMPTSLTRLDETQKNRSYSLVGFKEINNGSDGYLQRRSRDAIEEQGGIDSKNPILKINESNSSFKRGNLDSFKSFNSSSSGRSENDFNSALNDEEVVDDMFDWRKREDTYTKTKPEDFPYSVLLILMLGDKMESSCTGSLLTDQWVLTAAHCVYNKESAIIYAGGNSIQEYKDFKKNDKALPSSAQLLKSAELIPHPQYKEEGDSDIGLIKVDGTFNMTTTVNVTKLSTVPWGYHSYKTCQLTGFGVVQIGETRKDDIHRKTHNLDVKNPCLCSFRLELLFGVKKTSRYLCTRPKQDYGVCPGDSGGGLLCDGEIRGVAMQLVKLRETEFCDFSLLAPMKCGGVNTLSIFEDTCSFLPWINQHVRLFNASDISPKCHFVSIASPIHGLRSSWVLIVVGIVLIKIFLL